MTISLADLFDDYSLRARVYPALLTSLPAVTTALLLWPDPGWEALSSVLVAAGGAFFLANFVRSRGKRLERRLILEWGGLPSTHMLRHREVANLIEFERRRRGLERVYGQSLPTPAEERESPDRADAHYVAATRALIARVPDNPKSYPRVHEENIQYGFRRNLLALKPIGLVITGSLIVADVVVALVDFHTAAAVAMGINVLVLLAWLAVVNRGWVQEVGQSYAERLFETLEQDGLTSP